MVRRGHSTYTPRLTTCIGTARAGLGLSNLLVGHQGQVVQLGRRCRRHRPRGARQDAHQHHEDSYHCHDRRQHAEADASPTFAAAVGPQLYARRLVRVLSLVPSFEQRSSWRYVRAGRGYWFDGASALQ